MCELLCGIPVWKVPDEIFLVPGSGRERITQALSRNWKNNARKIVGMFSSFQ